MSQTVGLLRVLAPEIFAFIGVTILIVLAALFGRRVASASGKAESADHATVVKAQRTIAAVARWVWYVLAALFLWHALTVTWSLRIPRSDVDATGVYRQMDSLTRGNR